MERQAGVDAAPNPLHQFASTVTARLTRALESPRPQPRYYFTTRNYKMGVLKRGLPTRMLDRVLHKAAG